MVLQSVRILNVKKIDLNSRVYSSASFSPYNNFIQGTVLFWGCTDIAQPTTINSFDDLTDRIKTTPETLVARIFFERSFKLPDVVYESFRRSTLKIGDEEKGNEIDYSDSRQDCIIDGVYRVFKKFDSLYFCEFYEDITDTAISLMSNDNITRLLADFDRMVVAGKDIDLDSIYKFDNTHVYYTPNRRIDLKILDKSTKRTLKNIDLCFEHTTIFKDKELAGVSFIPRTIMYYKS